MAGIYLHIPFCRVRCPYCDFNTYAGIDDRIPAYVDALLRDLREQLSAQPEPLDVETIYFGGGTPSLLPASAVASLLDAIAAGSALRPAAEVTLEANPGTVDRAGLEALRAAGINRLTIGCQSFQPELLAALGRAHTVNDTRAAIAAARQAGFDNLNLDLMFGLTGQDLEAWGRDLDAALACDPQHLSLYNLTVEPGTPYARQQAQGRLPLPGEEEQRAMYELAWSRSADAGLERYEVSNFARPGRQCRHNRLYWEGDAWLGVGAGAHGYQPPRAGDAHWGRRAWNLRGVGRYIAAVREGRGPEEGHEELTREEAMTEALLLGLRLREGLDRPAFASRFGFDPAEAMGAALDRAVEAGLAEVLPGRIRTTEAGGIIADYVVQELCVGLDTFVALGKDAPSRAGTTARALGGSD